MSDFPGFKAVKILSSLTHILAQSKAMANKRHQIKVYNLANNEQCITISSKNNNGGGVI